MLAPLLLVPLLLASAPDEEAGLKVALARFAPVDLTADVSGLAAEDQKALARIVAAAQVMDGIFLQQVWGGNVPLLMRLTKDPSPLGKLRLHAFLLYKGPWDRLEHDRPFMPGIPPKPPGADFYPEDTSKAELESWLAGLPEPERSRARGFYTVIRRAPDGHLSIVPFSVQYQGELARAGGLLKEAAALTSQPSLRAFLVKRAEAFRTNDYYASDLAWMELASPIEVTLGPYEVYEDDWFNAKAAFEAFIGIEDARETQKLARFSRELQDLENHLPIDPSLRNPKLGALAPIRVINLLFATGDAAKGVQTAAYNLPNDERITREKGTKRVMLKNVQEAKFKSVLIPVSRAALTPSEEKNVAFEPFFTHILMHELMHGLGPHSIQVGGRTTTVRQELESTYSAIEEAKADATGLWALQYLIDKGLLDRSLERTMYTTYLASAFRSIRFGLNEAHGLGIALQLNYLLDAGAVAVADGRFRVVPERIKAGVAALTHELLMVEAGGSRAKAEELLKRLGVIRPPVREVLRRLSNVPVDIEPRYLTAGRLLSELGRPQ